MIKNAKEGDDVSTQTGCKTQLPDLKKFNLIERKKCDKHWQEVRNSMRSKDDVVEDQFLTTYRIAINNEFCYKPDLWDEKGWCYIAPTTAEFIKNETENPKENWGFCSRSCNLEFMEVIRYYTYIFSNDII